jgi:hypothetical protein
MGQTGAIVDASGKPVPGLEHVKIADTSWIRSGVPTYNTFEQRKYKDMAGRYKFQPDTGTSARASKDVTIHYNVTNHITGDGIEHKMAAIHKKHIDQMSKDLVEVQYLQNRSNFDGARAV